MVTTAERVPLAVLLSDYGRPGSTPDPEPDRDPDVLFWRGVLIAAPLAALLWVALVALVWAWLR